jgi:hypothetical protein
VFFLRQILCDGNWQILRKNSNSRVASFNFAKVPVAMIPIKFNWIFLECIVVDFCLVQAKDIWFEGINILVDVLSVENSSHSVYIPQTN